MHSFPILRKENGQHLPHLEYSALILNVRAVRAFSLKLTSILLFKSRIWLLVKVRIAIFSIHLLYDKNTPGESKPFIRNVFTLNTCAHIVGSQVLIYEQERDLLMGWRDFVEEVDPDIIIGYNMANFDLPYLLDRAHALKLEDFTLLGRIRGIFCSLFRKHKLYNYFFVGSKAKVKDTHFSSRAFGQRDSKETTFDGRLQLDLLQFMQREHKLRSYTLNSVCAQFLGEQKEDVHHSIITELQNGTPESRRRLAVYCLKV